MISYVVYRRLGIAFLGGLSGIVSFVIILCLLDYALWICGTISGVIGGTILAIGLSKYYKPIIPKFIIDRRMVISLFVIAGLILPIYICYSSEKADLEFCITDPSGNVSYSGYSEPKIREHDNIDILRLESSIIGNSVILETEFAGEIKVNDATQYTYYIATQKQNLWTDIIDLKHMEQEGKTLRAKIPIESLKDRKIFQVLIAASEIDESQNLDFYDNCSNKGDFWQLLKILTS